MKTFAGLLALAIAPATFAAPPPAPVLSVGVSDIRQLQFDWDPVPGVARYELWFRAAPGASWVKYTEQAAQRAPLFRIGVSVHLLDWRQASYYLKACNPSGCTPSNTVEVDGLQLAAMGFVKPESPRSARYFGSDVAASADGKTFAVFSDQSLGFEKYTATVHVYARSNASSGWYRQARLLPSPETSYFSQLNKGDPIALSGDGNLLVMGNVGEHVDGAQYAGAVYVFRRNGTTWTQTQKISPKVPNDNFGLIVKVDDAGRTLVISHGQQPDRGLGTEPRGTLAVYRDAKNDGSDQFVLSQSVPVPPNLEDPEALACLQLALSGDGKKILRGCRWESFGSQFVQVLDAPGWTESARLQTGFILGLDTDGDGSTALVESNASAFLWESGAAGWQLKIELPVDNSSTPTDHRHVALSRDGKFAAFGTVSNYSLGVGPVYPPFVAGPQSHPSGGVSIFERKPSGWVLRRLVKPGSNNVGFAGHSVALGDNGRLLIVGAPADPSAAAGFDGDREGDSSPNRGAVWVY
jgi:hypothetical protein